MNTTQVTSTPALLSNGLATALPRRVVRAPGLLASRWFWAGGAASMGVWAAVIVAAVRFI